jgi:hypothetical protein
MIMAAFELDVNDWAEEQFGSSDFNDARLTKRAVKVAAQMAADPSGSTPEQTETWADCKAAYRLMDHDRVTFPALAEPHWKSTRAALRGRCLLIDDTTTICFERGRRIQGMGIVQDERHPGFLLHTALALDPVHGAVVGVAGQVIRHRKKKLRREKHARDRLTRDRESLVWGDLIDLVGPPREEAAYVHVCDRGADNFEVFCRLLRQRSQWVIRAAQLDRLVIPHEGPKCRLDDHLATCPVAGTYDLNLKATTASPARTAQVEVRSSSLKMPAPQSVSPFVKRTGIREIPTQVVEVREVNPPKNVEPLHWVLYAAQEVNCFEDAWQVVEDYEKRWTVEDYHKALKTGCRLEDRLYETAQRLEAVTGILSVIAVRLLQLRTAARSEPQRPAKSIVPAKWIALLEAVQKGKQRPLTTVYEFYRALARLGGFLGRKHDGEPGWITLWRGFDKLHLLVRGAEALQQAKRCG